MHPYRDVPSIECNLAAVLYNCPECNQKAGYRCKSSGGTFYNARLRVHQDRLIVMWRTAYLRGDLGFEGWDAGYEHGKVVGVEEGMTEGWSEGVLDARYTFENTLVCRGARERDELRVLKEGVQAELAEGSNENAGGADSADAEGERSLRVVPSPDPS